MRIKTYALGITASLGLTVAWFVGCGGNVAESSSGSGSGGSTTTMSTTHSTTTSVTATTTTVSTSTTMTGTSPCDMACAHIQMCTGFTCMQAGIDCSTVGTQFDCVANCAANTPCASLGLGTLMMCQNQCNGVDGGAGDGGAGDGGMMISQCSTCLLTSCGTGPGLACAQDPSCMPWIGCVNTCNSASPPVASCYQACDTMYAAGKAKYDPVYQCGCTSCMTQCSGENFCAHGMDGGP